MQEYLFVEKYAPQSVDQCILPSEIKKVFTEFRDTGNIPNIILTGSPGIGKQMPVSEPVLTPLGWSTMGAIRPGDYVIGSAGLPIKVLSIHPQGVKDVYTVKTMDGVNIRCGKDHLWSVWVNHHGKNILKTYTTQELIDKGVRRSSGVPRFTLPKFDGLQEGISVSFGYALGYCLGNACFSQRQLYVSYDERIESKLLPLLKSSLGTPSTSRVADGTYSGRSLYSWSNIHPEIAKYRDSGLSHDKCLHKDHSDWLLWDYQSRLELLQGLLDSDGSVSLYERQKLRFTSTSINLIVLVRDLVRSLGGRACEPIAENRTHYKSGNCWNLSFRMPVCPFKLKADKWKLGNCSMQSSISEIVQNDYQEEQVCIRVDAEDHLYVTTGFKLTHNTSSIKALVRDLGMDLLFINGSNEGRYLDTIRDKVVQFCSTVSMLNDTPQKKVVLIDEFDNTLDSVQLCLRGVIEEFQSNVIFVFTVNNYNKVLPAILSRCSTIEYVIPKEEKKQMMIDVYQRLAFILEQENISFEKPVLISLIKNLFPDIRKLFNAVQRHSVGGVLDCYSLNIVSSDNIVELVDLMKNKKFESMRIWVSKYNTSISQSYRLLYNALINTLEAVGLAHSIQTIADYQHKANFAVDQEINFLACIIEIAYSPDVKWK